LPGQQRLQKTIVLVTHDCINEAIRLGDKIAIFQEGGVLAQFDSPDRILAHPAASSCAALPAHQEPLITLQIRRLAMQIQLT
jgi:ABC-type proline/glycine betaine transport system ATPase subunit